MLTQRGLQMTTTEIFQSTAHKMIIAAEVERAERQIELRALLTLLEQTTQSRSIAERCAKAKGALS